MPVPKGKKAKAIRPTKKPGVGNKKPKSRPAPAPPLPQHQGHHQVNHQVNYQGYHQAYHQDYNQNYQYNDLSYTEKANGRLGALKKQKKSAALAVFVFLTYIASIIMGGFIAGGCSTAMAKNLFLAELHVNQTHDIYFRVGYFGGCLSVANLNTSSTSTTNTSTSNEPQVHCVTNMRTTDPEDLGEEFWEDLHLPAATQASVQDALNATLPYTRQLQSEVFFWSPPVLHMAFFFLSGIILFVASTAASGASLQRPAYKAVVLTGVIMGAFALGLALTATIGTTQMLNSLLLPLGGGSEAKTAIAAKAPVYMRRGGLLNGLQSGLVAVVTIFYVLIGALFVRRRK
ncbi:hypothetical protein PGQ11_015014 [Apiospora arundinis]|uniref:Actin cortical patch SUR7/pH-response regulator PalI n=1 Tax=Apiospora arundinis TaxID=335852 RepID=A0ABR2HLA7_9PEZI